MINNRKSVPLSLEARAAIDRQLAAFRQKFGPIYAYKKTGRIVTEENKRLLSEEELDEWNDAIDEYHRRVNSGEII